MSMAYRELMQIAVEAILSGDSAHVWVTCGSVEMIAGQLQRDLQKAGESCQAVRWDELPYGSGQRLRHGMDLIEVASESGRWSVMVGGNNQAAYGGAGNLFWRQYSKGEKWLELDRSQ